MQRVYMTGIQRFHVSQCPLTILAHHALRRCTQVNPRKILSHGLKVRMAIASGKAEDVMVCFSHECLAVLVSKDKSILCLALISSL